MAGDMIGPAFRVCCLLAALLFVAGPACAQSSAPAVSGRWVWQALARKHKPRTEFTISIQRKGNLVSGNYSVDEFIDGVWQGEDGNQTAFRGRITSSGVEIEFDPSATVPGYQQNVVYKVPGDGRKPTIAVLKFKDGTLLWHIESGGLIEALPARFALHRERRPK